MQVSGTVVYIRLDESIYRMLSLKIAVNYDGKTVLSLCVLETSSCCFIFCVWVACDVICMS